MLRFCNSNSIGGSQMSTPIGMSPTPASSSIDLICSAALVISPASGGTVPRRPSMPAWMFSSLSQGAWIRWCEAAEPKSQTCGSSPCISSA